MNIRYIYAFHGQFNRFEFSICLFSSYLPMISLDSYRRRKNRIKWEFFANRNEEKGKNGREGEKAKSLATFQKHTLLLKVM